MKTRDLLTKVLFSFLFGLLAFSGQSFAQPVWPHYFQNLHPKVSSTETQYLLREFADECAALDVLGSQRYISWQNRGTSRKDRALEEEFDQAFEELKQLSFDIVDRLEPSELFLLLQQFPSLASRLGIPQYAHNLVSMVSIGRPKFGIGELEKFVRHRTLVRFLEFSEEEDPEFVAWLLEMLIKAEAHWELYGNLLARMDALESQRQYLGYTNDEKIDELRRHTEFYQKAKPQLAREILELKRATDHPRYEAWLNLAQTYLDESPDLPQNIGEGFGLPFYYGFRSGLDSLASVFHRFVLKDPKKASEATHNAVKWHERAFASSHYSGLRMDRLLKGATFRPENSPTLVGAGASETFLGVFAWLGTASGHIMEGDIGQGAKVLFIDFADGLFSLAAARDDFVEDWAEVAQMRLQAQLIEDETIRQEKIIQAGQMALANRQNGYFNPHYSAPYAIGAVMGAKKAFRLMVVPIRYLRSLNPRIQEAQARAGLETSSRGGQGFEWKPLDEQSRIQVESLIESLRKSENAELQALIQNVEKGEPPAGLFPDEGGSAAPSLSPRRGSGGGGPATLVESRPTTGSQTSTSTSVGQSARTLQPSQPSPSQGPVAQIQTPTQIAQGLVVGNVELLHANENEGEETSGEESSSEFIERLTREVRELQKRLFDFIPALAETFGSFENWVLKGMPLPRESELHVREIRRSIQLPPPSPETIPDQLIFNSPEYFRWLFTAVEALDKAEQEALTDALQGLNLMTERGGDVASDATRLSQIFQGVSTLNLSDFDGTRSRLEDLGEARNTEVDQRAEELHELEANLGLHTVKVSGRPLVWPEIGLLGSSQASPPLAIGEAGAAMAIDGVPSEEYQGFIDQRSGFNRSELDLQIRILLSAMVLHGEFLEAWRPQAQNGVTHKIAYDVKLKDDSDGETILKLQLWLQEVVGERAKVVQSHFIEAENVGHKNVYRIDIVPGDKADAADYVANQLAEADASLPMITAGDSGNDVGLVTAALNAEPVPLDQVLREIVSGKPLSSNVFIAVANRSSAISDEIHRVSIPATTYAGSVREKDHDKLRGVYFIQNEAGVLKVILDDAEMKTHRFDLPEHRHGPESILNAYELIFRPQDSSERDPGEFHDLLGEEGGRPRIWLEKEVVVSPTNTPNSSEAAMQAETLTWLKGVLRQRSRLLPGATQAMIDDVAEDVFWNIFVANEIPIHRGKNPNSEQLTLLHVTTHGHHGDPVPQKVKDTGGQTVWTLEHTKEYARQGHIAFQIGRMHGTYPRAESLLQTENGGRAWLVRVKSGEPDFIRKEELYDHIPKLALATTAVAALAGADVVIGNYAEGMTIANEVAFRTGIPVVDISHSLGKVKALGLDRSLSDSRAIWKPDYNFGTRFGLEELALLSAHGVVHNSPFEEEQQQHLYHLPKREYIVLPGGAVKPFFDARANPADAETLAQFGLEPGKYIIWWGRIAEVKTPERLVRVLGEAKALNPELMDGYKAVIIGGNPANPPEDQAATEDRIRAAAEEYGLSFGVYAEGSTPKVDVIRVEAQDQDKIAPLTAASLTYVGMQDYDAFCMGAAEAMAAGKAPIISRESGEAPADPSLRFGNESVLGMGIAKMLTDGRNAFLVNPRNSAEAGARLTEMVNDEALRLSMEQAAAEYADAEFNFRPLAQRQVAQVEDVLARSKSQKQNPLLGAHRTSPIFLGQQPRIKEIHHTLADRALSRVRKHVQRENARGNRAVIVLEGADEMAVALALSVQLNRFNLDARVVPIGDKNDVLHAAENLLALKNAAELETALTHVSVTSLSTSEVFDDTPLPLVDAEALFVMAPPGWKETYAQDLGAVTFDAFLDMAVADALSIQPNHIVGPGELPIPMEVHAKKAEQIAAFLTDKVPVGEKKVITISGAYGFGRTEIARLVADHLADMGRYVTVTSLDNWPILSPDKNDARRRYLFGEGGQKGLETLDEFIGTQHEIDFNGVNELVSKFKRGVPELSFKIISRETNKAENQVHRMAEVEILIIEGTFPGLIEEADLRIHLDGNHAQVTAPEGATPEEIRAVEFQNTVLDIEQRRLNVMRRFAKSNPFAIVIPENLD